MKQVQQTQGPFDMYDAIVIGAGAAGVGAARTLVQGGARVLVLEARNRVGGRIWCDNTTFPVPVDLGAQWFHQGLNNPLRVIAQQQGYTTVHDVFPRVIFDGQQQLDATDERVLEFGGLALALSEQLNEAGGAVAAGSGPDYPGSDVMDKMVAEMKADLEADAEDFTYLPMASTAANLFSPTMKELSVLDFANFYDKTLLPVSSGGGDEFLIPSGLGNFIADLADGLPVELSTPVKEILWGEDWGVQITTAFGTVIRAKTVIITVPVGVLARHDSIKFTPALDPAYTEAFNGLKMETLSKVFIQFNDQVKFDVPNINSMCAPLTATSEVPYVGAAIWGENIAMLFLLGKLAESMEQGSEQDLIDYALKVMASMFGPHVKKENVIAISHHSWLKDEWSRGCASYAPPGAVPFRKRLATPIKDQVFFAGEAVSIYAHSSAHGAYETGVAAARKILKLL